MSGVHTVAMPTSSTIPTPPARIPDQLLLSHRLPEGSIWIEVMCCIAALWNPSGGERSVPVDDRGGHAALFAPHSNHTPGLENPDTHTRSDPSTASAHGKKGPDSLNDPGIVPPCRISITVLLSS